MLIARTPLDPSPHTQFSVFSVALGVGSRLAPQRGTDAALRAVVDKSEHVPGESIFVTALTMLKAAKKGMPAPGSKVRATFIEIGELPGTATH